MPRAYGKPLYYFIHNSWGRGGRTESGMVPYETALVISYRPSIVTFQSIFTRFRDIAAFVLQHATFPHPTSTLPQIFPCFPVIRWMAFGFRRVKMLVRAIISKISNLCYPDPPTLQRDKQTDGQTTCSPVNTAL